MKNNNINYHNSEVDFNNVEMHNIYETFVPLYITNHCDSYCHICNMRFQNKNIKRIEGNKDQILSQLRIIKEVEGISSICFLSGEYLRGQKRKKNLERIFWCIDEALKQGYEKVYFNIGALYDDELKAFSINFSGSENIVLSLFQETYFKACYNKFFGSNIRNNPKADYELRISTPQRWLDIGFKQVDLGILLGLMNPKYDINRLIEHAMQLNSKGAIVHISLPRLRGLRKIPFTITDEEFKGIVSNINKKCPWSKLIITTREDIKMINELLEFISIISAGSSDVLPYTEKGSIPNNILTSQFQVAPIRKRPSWILDSLCSNDVSFRYYDLTQN